jgi:hypothetical protein
MTLRIDSPGDLERAALLVSWLARPSVRQVHVRLPWLTPAQCERAGRTLTRYFNDCGCLWGAPAFVAALPLSFAHGPWTDASGLLAGGASLAAAVGAALAAKAAALAWSAWRLRVLLARLARGSGVERRTT